MKFAVSAEFEILALVLFRFKCFGVLSFGEVPSSKFCLPLEDVNDGLSRNIGN